MQPGDTLTLTLRILPDAGPADADQRVRSLLKVALRRFGLKNEGCIVQAAQKPAPPPPAKAPKDAEALMPGLQAGEFP